MASYNHEDFVGEAIESVLSQTYADWELIIVDDQSPDDSWNVISKYSDPRIHAVQMPSNSGGSQAYNEALRMSAGQLLMTVDSDDAYRPDKIRKQLAYLQAAPHLGVVGTFIETIGDVDIGTGDDAAVSSWFNSPVDLNDPKNWIWQNRLAHSSVAITRNAHDLIGSMREDLHRTPDWDLWLRAKSKGVKFAVIHEPLTLYRVQSGSVTHADLTATVAEYLSMSGEHWHAHLRQIGRSDLVIANLTEALDRYGAMDEKGRARITGILGGLIKSEPEAAQTALNLAESTFAAREAKDFIETKWRTQGYRLSDVRESEQAAREYLVWAKGDEAARHEKEVSRLNRVTANQREVIRHPWRRKNRAKIGDVLKRKAPTISNPFARANIEPAHRPKFSIIIPVYNNGPCLRNAVESVRAQTLPDFEIVLWDDGTTDQATLDVLNGLTGPGIQKYGADNQGVVGARNSAVSKSKGEFIIFLDPDDALEPTYLEKALIAFSRYPDIDLVAPTTRVVQDGVADIIWHPEFNAKLLPYHNTVPIATAFRRRVWDAVGGMSEHMSGGFEDWAFWRNVTSRGYRGQVLKDPLFRYTYSPTSGRDADAHKVRDDLERRIKIMYPVFHKRDAPQPQQQVSVRNMLRSQVFHKPASGKRGLVIFVPWMLRGGGAENFLLNAIPSLREDFEVVVVATETPPAGFATCEDDFAAATPYIYDIPELVAREDSVALASSILYRFLDLTVLIVGSPWAYQHIGGMKKWPRGKARIVDMQFNHVGHLAELLIAQEKVDLVLTAHDHLRALLTNYYGIKAPVKTVYVAPPPRESSAEARESKTNRRRLQIGWLGRHSPEKRTDLVLKLAAVAPECDFFLAGSALDSLQSQVSDFHNVEIVGWVKDPGDFLARCDMVINTSDTEGVSLTAMEALELGIPVLTRDIGGMSELVEDGHNGLVYDAANLAGLAERLRDGALISRIREQADIERLPDRFSQKQMIESLTAALKEPEKIA